MTELSKLSPELHKKLKEALSPEDYLEFNEYYMNTGLHFCETVRRCISLESELIETIDKLQKALTGELTLKQAISENGGFSIKLGLKTASVLAESMYALLEGHGAENYVELHLSDGEEKNIIVTVQKKDGKTPHQLRVESEERLKGLTT